MATSPAHPAPSGAVIRDRLAGALHGAMRDRDRAAVRALRGALAALGNAEAVEVPAVSGPTRTEPARSPAASAHVAASSVGLGSTEVARRTLDDATVRAVVLAEADEHERAAATYDAAGHGGRAAELRAQGVLLRDIALGRPV